MLDIKLFRETPNIIRENLRKRGASTDNVDAVIEADANWRAAVQEADRLRQKRNETAKLISQLKKEKQDATEHIASMGNVKDEIEKNELLIQEHLDRRDALRKRIPNLMHESVPVGKDDSENVEVRKWGTPKQYDFELKSHQEIIEGLEMGDFSKPGETSGAGFYYLKDEMVMLDLALQRFAIDSIRKKGFTVVAPPMMLRRKAMEGMVDLSDFEEVLYKVEDDDLYLIATSEHPMGALHMGEIIIEKKLPIRYAGVTPCFRREVGAHGLDTRGLFRTHQFNKVEQFVYSLPEDSWEEMESLIGNAEELFQALEIPYRITNICTGDLGGTAAKKYDLEAWMAKQGVYQEVVSCSNCTDYQARKLNIRVERPDGGREMLHTLNSTAIATSRAIVALLENNQLPDGSVEVPKALRPYMGGLEVIEARNG